MSLLLFEHCWESEPRVLSMQNEAPTTESQPFYFVFHFVGVLVVKIILLAREVSGFMPKAIFLR